MAEKTYHSYSEEDKAAALALLELNEGNITRTARALKMPSTTLRQWRDGEHINGDVAKKRDGKKGELTVLFEEVLRIYAERALEQDAIDETKGKDAVIAMATALDKLQLLNGGATARIGLTWETVMKATDDGSSTPDDSSPFA